ncbi:hypothetical protein [Chryseobacterium sp. FH2]|uniref:hypothetical protein n=1 Tax=Chryseobacterium sp. FH2 TaxID=1674291 RepID=UPI0016166AD3|nr:hypothetical protein [Chryseobacterium sp. FH2]
MFEKFDFDLDNTDYVGYEYAEDSYNNYGENGYYKLKTSGVFNPYNGGYPYISYTVVPSSTAFYSIRYTYFENGNLEKQGRIAGFNSGIKIGKWKFYDEIGRMTEVDEDKKFGLWTFEKVLEKLDKDGVINLETGKNREYEKLNFFFDKDKKEWTVKVFKKEINEVTEEYWEYIFDGNTGKYSREWYERYNSKAEKDMNLPPLKNGKKRKSKRLTEVYKTYQGKAYTQAEWEAYEEKEYEAYCKRTGRPYTPKSQELTAENQEDKSPFLAEDWEKGDDKTPRKKKGFWDNLFG